MADSFKKYNKWIVDIEKSYRPFLTTNSVNKYSRRHQYFCPFQSRIIHLLSDGELYAYRGLINTPGITEVFEQYALDPEYTVKISEKLGYKHPTNQRTGSPYIMSTDFVAVRGIKRTAYTFKYHKDLYQINRNGNQPNLSKRRTWEKLAIEDAFWKLHGIEYRIITERDFTKSQYYNLRRCEYAANLGYADDFTDEFVCQFMELWISNPYQQLDKIINQCADIMNATSCKCIDLFHHCVFKKKLPIDHSVIFQMHLPLQLLTKAGINE